eukprot:NODE_465_length_8145_cov_0.434999.p2 type:complete len:483 gc:universal NODE_465_length_8145_cov_0.434999:2231-783(-)
MRIINSRASQFHASPIMSLNYNQDRGIILAGDEKGTLHVYSEKLRHITSHFLHHQCIHSLDSCKDYIATISSDGQGILSDFKGFDPISLIGDTTQGLKSVDICPFNTSKLLTSGKEGRISLFDIRVKPSISFGVDHFYTIKDFKNGPCGSIKYCVGRCIWITENHFVSFGITDNTLKLFDIRNNKTYTAENTLERKISDVCKSHDSLSVLSEGNIISLNNWDLNVNSIYKTGLRVSQYSKISWQDSTSVLAISNCAGSVGYLCFNQISDEYLSKRRTFNNTSSKPSMYSNPTFFQTKSSTCEINSIQFLGTPYAVVTGDDVGNLRIWETEYPGNDIQTAVLPVGLSQSELDGMKISKFYDSESHKYQKDTIHVFEDPNAYADPEEVVLRSNYVPEKSAAPKASNLLTPVKKKRKTLDPIELGILADENDLKIVKEKRIVQSRLNYSTSEVNENHAPQGRRRGRKRSTGIKMDSLLNYGFTHK